VVFISAHLDWDPSPFLHLSEVCEHESFQDVDEQLLQSEVGQVLDDLGRQREGPSGERLGVRLYQSKQGRIENGRT